MHMKDQTSNIMFYRNYWLRNEKDIKLKSINKIIRIIDTRDAEQEYIKNKLGYKHDLIDLEARNAFKVGKVTILMIKYIYGYNHYSQWDIMINEYMVEATYPRCDLIETWEHVLHCNKNKKGKPGFTKDFIKTLFKKKSKEVKEDEVMSFTEDIMKYIRGNENGE